MNKPTLHVALLCLAIAAPTWAQTPAAGQYAIAAPEEATLFVGTKTKHFVPFTEVIPVSRSTADGTTTYLFEYKGGVHNYRVSAPGAVTCADKFTPKDGETIAIAPEQLAGDPRQLDRDPASNNGYNVADIFLNINERGHLRLQTGKTFQIVSLRNWEAVDNIVNNYFIEPDYRYTVLDEDGQADETVVTVDDNGLLTARSAGTAIVLVTYDAIRIPSAAGGPMFGALWPENTGVFVVSVDEGEPGIDTGMTLNADLNAAHTDSRLAGTAIDAELDVLYYAEGTDGYRYTFTPTGATEVLLARPTLSDADGLAYHGFGTEGVTANEDGSYTVCLTEGRNIVKLASDAGTEYQVLTAKPVTCMVTNLTSPGDTYLPGDEVSVRFATLYHPCNKLAGVYNMTANIQYSDGTSTYSNKGSQYTFASTEAAQTLTLTIPAGWPLGTDFTLAQGALYASGFGDPYGNHRAITYDEGKDVNFTAGKRTAYFGSLPAISLPVGQPSSTGLPVPATQVSIYPNPFADYLTVSTESAGNATLYTLSGQAVLQAPLHPGSNRLDTHALPQGTYVLKCGDTTVKVVK